MATDTEGSSLTYFAGASKFVKGIVPDDSSHTSPHMLLMTGLASVLHALPPSKQYISAINVEEITNSDNYRNSERLLLTQPQPLKLLRAA